MNLLPSDVVALAIRVISDQVRIRLQEFGSELTIDEFKSITSALYKFGDNEDETNKIVQSLLNNQLDELYWTTSEIGSVEELDDFEKQFIQALTENGIPISKAKYRIEKRREELYAEEDEWSEPYGSHVPASPRIDSDDAIKSMFEGLRQRK
jgi:hypothetical protein